MHRGCRRDLSRVSLFRALTRAELEAIEQRCRWLNYRAGSCVLPADETEHDVYFVVDGLVRVVSQTAAGREIAYANVGPGGYFGELGAFEEGGGTASVVAVEDSVLAAVPRKVFADLMLGHREIALQVFQRLARIIWDCDQRILNLSTLKAVQRVYVELLRLARPSPLDPSTYLIRPVPNHSDVAAWASTSRETVARVISQLGRSGVIERKDRALYIRERAKLEHLAEALDSGPEGVAAE